MGQLLAKYALKFYFFVRLYLHLNNNMSQLSFVVNSWDKHFLMTSQHQSCKYSLPVLLKSRRMVQFSSEMVRTAHYVLSEYALKSKYAFKPKIEAKYALKNANLVQICTYVLRRPKYAFAYAHMHLHIFRSLLITVLRDILVNLYCSHLLQPSTV